jgi:hypothetical protein
MMLAGVASHSAPPGTGLAGDLYTALVGAGVCTANASTAALCTALASAIVEHVSTHAVITPTLLIAPPGGGPVTGTGTIA